MSVEISTRCTSPSELWLQKYKLLMSSSSNGTILIVGATTTVGQVVSRRFARRGWSLALLDRDSRAFDGLLREVKGGTSVFVERVDPSDQEAVQAAFDRFEPWSNGRLDVLLNATTHMYRGRFEALSLAEHREHIDRNLWTTLVATHTAFPLLRDTDGARVINLASPSGIYGTPDLASYSAAKSGVRTLTQALNLEWAHHDIHVCDIISPHVGASDAKTDHEERPRSQEAVSSDSSRELAADLTQDDVADVVDRAVTEDKIHWPVGRQFRWMYRLSDVLPAPLVRLFMRYVSGF